MNSPSRTQTGDSSSISSFSYREILREKESSAAPARVKDKEEAITLLFLPQTCSTPLSLKSLLEHTTSIFFPLFFLELDFEPRASCIHSTVICSSSPAEAFSCPLFPKLANLASYCYMRDGNHFCSLALFHHLQAHSTFPGTVKYMTCSKCTIHVGGSFLQLILIIIAICHDNFLVSHFYLEIAFFISYIVSVSCIKNKFWY